MKHLTKDQLTFLKDELTRRRQELREQVREELLRSDNERYEDLAGQVHDAGDESVADLLADANVAMVSRLITQLRETEAALQKMNMGSYGLCDEGGEEIPFERLRVAPAASRCIEHQRLFEQNYAAGGGRPSKL